MAAPWPTVPPERPWQAGGCPDPPSHALRGRGRLWRGASGASPAAADEAAARPMSGLARLKSSKLVRLFSPGWEETAAGVRY